jgi:hypothetical protein
LIHALMWRDSSAVSSSIRPSWRMDYADENRSV